MIRDFKCIADKCKHSCCVGWEIDIDDETLSIYEGMPGEFGERIRSSIASENGTHHFILDKNERCPFLNENNLCDIILNLGEDYLCDICSAHPRFYVETEGKEGACGADYECGYGMCCEEAARLIISDTEDKGDFVKKGFEKYVSLPDMQSPEKITAAADFLNSLEKLGSSWESWLNNIHDRAVELGRMYHSEYYRNQMYTNIFDYLYFRYRNVEYAGFMMEVLILISESIRSDMEMLQVEKLVEICRVYSAEIEYSDENVEKIIEWLDTY